MSEVLGASKGRELAASGLEDRRHGGWRQAVADAWVIAWKDILDFTRDRMRLISFVIMPIFMMVMTGYIFPNQNSLQNMPLAVVNQDQGPLSRMIVDALNKMTLPAGGGQAGQGMAALGEAGPGKTASRSRSGNPVFRIQPAGSLAEAKELIKSGQANGAVFIPRDFTRQVGQGKQPHLVVVTDQANLQISSMLSSVLDQFLGAMATQVGAQKVAPLLAARETAPGPRASAGASGDVGSAGAVPGEGLLQMMAGAMQQAYGGLGGAGLQRARATVQPFVVRIEGIVPGPPNYFQFMAPGIMAMVVVMAVMMGLAGAISREREIGTLDGILIAPINRLSIIIGKTISQSLRGLVQGAVVLILAILLFHVKVYGSIAWVAGLLLLGIFSFVGLGILISAFATEQETAMTILMTLQFPMMFLSGAFFPVQQMPTFMQGLSKLVPLTYAIDGLRKVIILGAGWSAIQTEVLVLTGFGLAMLLVAIPAFNRVITR